MGKFRDMYHTSSACFCSSFSVVIQQHLACFFGMKQTSEPVALGLAQNYFRALRRGYSSKEGCIGFGVMDIVSVRATAAITRCSNFSRRVGLKDRRPISRAAARSTRRRLTIGTSNQFETHHKND